METAVKHEGATRESIEAFAKEHDLAIKAEFVPWSRSRSFKARARPSDRSLNWKVTLQHKGRDIITTDYSAGVSHCPAYKAEKYPLRWTLNFSRLIEFETENGFPASDGANSVFRRPGSKPILPETASVLNSLVLDSDVLNYSSFEDWAPELGYDPDSRSAEKTYRQCLEIALTIRSGLGQTLFDQLSEAVQGF